jgi:lactoylglutathione lyase
VADHVAIQVSDVDKAAAFYRGVFGFPEIAAAVPGTRWFDLGAGTALHIIGGRRGAVRSSAGAGRPSHLAIRTAGLDPVLAALRSRGATWRDWDGTQGAITTREDGVRQIFLQDPDGHWLEVNDAARTR